MASIKVKPINLSILDFKSFTAEFSKLLSSSINLSILDFKFDVQTKGADGSVHL